MVRLGQSHMHSASCVSKSRINLHDIAERRFREFSWLFDHPV